MSLKLNAFLAILSVSLLGAFTNNLEAVEQVWYDSEGRPLVVTGKHVKRNLTVKSYTEPVVVEQKIVNDSSPPNVIPPLTELRTDLSTVGLISSSSFHHSSFNRSNSYYRGYSFFNRSYRTNRVYRNSYRSSYRGNNFSLRRNYYVR